MRIRRYSVETRQKLKAEERATDRQAARDGQAAERQARNRFIPNPKDWTIEIVPRPLLGEVLD